MITKLQIYESFLGFIFTLVLQAIKHGVQGKKSNIHLFIYCLVSAIGWVFHFLLRKDLVYKAKQLEKEKKLLEQEKNKIKQAKKKLKKKN